MPPTGYNLPVKPEPKPRVLFSSAQVQAKVKELATLVARDYREKRPVMVGILKGSFIFMADLIRLLDFPLQVEFFQVSSYGSGTCTSGQVKVLKDLVCPIEGKHVLLVEDIIDSGTTTAFVLDYLGKRQPASIKVCALLDKPSRRLVPVTIYYLGVTVPDKFVVGYGIDYDEHFRNLPSVCTVDVKC